MISKVSILVFVATSAIVYAHPTLDVEDELYSPYTVREFVDKNSRPPRAVVVVPEQLGEDVYFGRDQPISIATLPKRFVDKNSRPPRSADYVPTQLEEEDAYLRLHQPISLGTRPRRYVDKNARPPRSADYVPTQLEEEDAYLRLHQPISLGTRPRRYVDKNARPPRSAVYVPEQMEQEDAYLRLHQPISLGTRPRRSVQPGAPQIPQQSDSWILKPSVGRNDEGNTIANVDLKRNTKDFDFDAGWNKVVNGPGKAKPTWHAQATFRF